jgi:hypothetical protein
MMTLPSNIPKRGLSLGEASEYCGVSDNTLTKYGPKPSKIGERNVYDIRVLDRWLDSIASLPIGTGARRIEDPEQELLKAIHERKTPLRRATPRQARKGPLLLEPRRPPVEAASGGPGRAGRNGRAPQ